MTVNTQEVKVVSETTLASGDVKCPGCGGTVKYDPSTLKMVCEFCGTARELPPPEACAVVQEQDFNSAVQRASVNWGTVRKLVICSNCAGQILYDASQVSGCCPFCGSTNVMPAGETPEIMCPTGVIPFAFDKESAKIAFLNVVNRKHFVPAEIKKSKLENIVGVYLPFWTFDSYTVSSYAFDIGFAYSTGEGTSYRYRKYRGVKDWFIDDMVVFGTDKVNNPYIRDIEKFNFSKALPYDPQYLAGFAAERYTIGLNDGWLKACGLIQEKLKKDIGGYVCRCVKGDISRNGQLSTSYYNVTYKYVLAPVYFANYKYGNTIYPVVINGQTGEVGCKTPSYFLKVLFIIIMVMFGVPIAFCLLYNILRFIFTFI